MQFLDIFILWSIFTSAQISATTADILIHCDAPSVMESEPARLTCRFQSDLKKENRDFVVQHSNRRGQVSEILSCLWLTTDSPSCEIKPGYEYDKEISNTLNVTILSAAEQHEGMYLCLTIPSNLDKSKPCNFTLKGPIFTEQTTTFPELTPKLTTETWKKEDIEDEDNTLELVLAIVIPAVLVLLIFALIIKRRGTLSRLMTKREKESEKVYYIEAQPLVPVRKIKLPTTTQPDQPVEEAESTKNARKDQQIGPFEAKTNMAKSDGLTGTNSSRRFCRYLYNRAVGLVEKAGAVVITGPEKCGKSSLGRDVMNHFVEKGFYPLVLDHPNLWKKQGDREHVVLLDECNIDIWSRVSIKSMFSDNQCYIVFILRSNVMKNEGSEGFPSCLQNVPTVDLAKKVSPNAGASKQLFQACQKDDVYQVVAFLSGGVCADRTESDGRTPLHIASKRGHADIVTHLLWAESRVNAKDEMGLTPLHHACSFNPRTTGSFHSKSKQTNSESATYTVTQTPKDPQQINKRGVHKDNKAVFAFVNPREVVVKTLLVSGARLNAADNAGRTPLHVACEHSNHALVAMLLSCGANVDAKDADGHTPLHVACKHKDYELVKLLLNSHASVNAQDETGFTPLHVASKNNARDLVKSLVREKADVNAKENTNCTPLHVACASDAKGSVEMLLTANANVNARGGDHSMTPLHMACWNGSEAIVQMLLEKGADIHAPDKRGYTPDYLAESGGHRAIANNVRKAEVESRV